MTDGHEHVEPLTVAEAVENYVESELRDEAKYENRKPLDESGVWSLHALAARIYAQGWADGRRAADIHARGQRNRNREVTG
jgi:hypothetical protein